MLDNYLKIALRTVRRSPGFTLINVAGLALGMAACMLIFLFIQDELGYDRFHANADRLFRVVLTNISAESEARQATTPHGLAPALEQEIAEIVESVRFYQFGRTLVARDEQAFFVDDVFLVDSSALHVFSFDWVRGGSSGALSAPSSVVLSESTARTFFGESDPIGAVLRLNQHTEVTVTGVFRDFPEQSHLRPSILGSFETLYSYIAKERIQEWVWQQFYTYVLLENGARRNEVESRLPALLRRNADAKTVPAGFRFHAELQPLTDIHLHSTDLRFDIAKRGNITYVYAFALIALFVLAIAGVNFTNLAISRSIKRSREVGMRKVMGANRRQLTMQFLGESILMALMGLSLAIGLATSVLPAFRTLTGKSLPVSEISEMGMLAGFLASAVIVGVFAGAYPALYLSRFQPSRVLKSGRAGGGSSRLRHALVIVQFAVSIALIFGTGVIYRQLTFLQTAELGFDEEHLVVLPLRSGHARSLDSFKSELLRHSSIAGATASWGVPGRFVAGDGIQLAGTDKTMSVNMIMADSDFLETYRMELIAGEGFSEDRPAELQSGFIVNERAVHAMGLTTEEALEKEIEWYKWGAAAGGDPIKRGKVIGIARDFHFKSLHEELEPLVLHVYPPAFGQLSIRIKPERMAETLQFVEEAWKARAPEWPFEYRFLDEEMEEAYASEEKLSRVTTIFAVLAVVVACLGLFGLALFAAERRTKEIGIRKVLGASVARVVILFSREFAALVVIAFAIATPITYIMMDRWLESFTYRIDVGWQMLILSGIIAMLAAILSVGYQSVRTALRNPVQSLRYE